MRERNKEPSGLRVRAEQRAVLMRRLLGGQCGLHVGRERADPLDEGGYAPQLVVGGPLAVGKHSGPADAVLGDPENLGFRVFGTSLGKLGNRREQAVLGIVLVGLIQASVASGAITEVLLAAFDQVL